MEHVPVRIGPLSKIAIRKEKSIRERERGGGLSSLETSIPIFRGDECRMSTSHARRRFLSANAMKCVSLFFPALSGKHLRTWPVCRAAFYQLENFRSTNVLSPDYRDRFVRSEKRYENG